jgi:uncharacterized protein
LKPYYQEIKLVVGWQGMLVLGIVIGSLVSALLSSDFHWQWVPSLWASAFGNSPVLRVIVELIGGVWLGFGARWAGGCTSGHGISGTLQLAVSSWISAICFFIGGILMAQFLFKVFGYLCCVISETEKRHFEERRFWQLDVAATLQSQ